MPNYTDKNQDKPSNKSNPSQVDQNRKGGMKEDPSRSNPKKEENKLSQKS